MAEMKTLRLDLKAIKADHKELVEAITEIQSLMEETEGSEVSLASTCSSYYCSIYDISSF